jgi:CubicO group peptidase (beta-lactamase class C family)
MTAICALQCVEKGLLNLDDDISTVLSEWKDPKILMGFDKSTGEPILEPAKKIPTLRMLLTHQSGFGYPFVNPGLQQYTNYKKSKGEGESQLVVCVTWIQSFREGLS